MRSDSAKRLQARPAKAIANARKTSRRDVIHAPHQAKNATRLIPAIIQTAQPARHSSACSAMKVARFAIFGAVSLPPRRTNNIATAAAS
jgi:hypothetical protein